MFGGPQGPWAGHDTPRTLVRGRDMTCARASGACGTCDRLHFSRQTIGQVVVCNCGGGQLGSLADKSRRRLRFGLLWRVRIEDPPVVIVARLALEQRAVLGFHGLTRLGLQSAVAELPVPHGLRRRAAAASRLATACRAQRVPHVFPSHFFADALVTALVAAPTRFARCFPGGFPGGLARGLAGGLASGLAGGLASGLAGGFANGLAGALANGFAHGPGLGLGL